MYVMGIKSQNHTPSLTSVCWGHGWGHHMLFCDSVGTDSLLGRLAVNKSISGRAQVGVSPDSLVAMAELVQLELDEKDKENFAEMQAAMNEAQRELASLTMRGRTRHAEAKCVQRPPMRSRR